MAFVPGGRLAGRALREVCLDRTEVTVAAYTRCVEAGRCARPSGAGARDNWGRRDRARHPINNVTWNQARDFCRAVGKRLPTEWEWEWAARGREQGRLYPWGAAAPSCAYTIMEGGGRDGCGRGHTAPVASRPRGASRDGIHDLSGNVWEWTASGNTFGYVVRGGSLANKRAWRFQNSFRRLRLPPRRHDYATGFRCARAPTKR